MRDIFPFPCVLLHSWPKCLISQFSIFLPSYSKCFFKIDRKFGLHLTSQEWEKIGYKPITTSSNWQRSNPSSPQILELCLMPLEVLQRLLFMLEQLLPQAFRSVSPPILPQKSMPKSLPSFSSSLWEGTIPSPCFLFQDKRESHDFDNFSVTPKNKVGHLQVI